MASLILTPTVSLIIYFLIIWTVVWKSIALWYAGKHQDKKWFIVMAVLNTAGILPILYIFFFQKEPLHKEIKRKRLRKEE